MTSTRLPNFVHAGVPKSASATINTMLRDHPDVFLPRQKEPNFFNNDERFSQGLEWYKSTHFATVADEMIIGDMSIGYSTGFGVDAPKRIAETLGVDIKILLTFREPVARAYSQYGMSYNKGQLESLGFAEAIHRAMSIGPKVNDAERLRARTGSYYSKAGDMDVFRWCMYIQPGHYADILASWTAIFGSQNVLVLFTDDIASDLQSQADKLFAFLGVDSILVEAELTRNVATTLRYPWIRRTLNRLYAFKQLRRALNSPQMEVPRKWLRKSLLSSNYVENTNVRKPDPEAIECLLKHYDPQIARLEEVLRVDLGAWRTKYSLEGIGN